MRKLAFALLLILFASFPTFAQTTTVTGVVKDVNGVAYAGATMKAQLVLAGAGLTGQATVTVSSQAQCTSAGKGTAPCQVPFQGTVGPVTLDSGGNIPAGGLTVQDNSLVTPAGTQWLFSVTTTGAPPPIGTGPQACTVTLTITGASQSITSNFSCPLLSNISPGGSANQIDPTQPPFNVQVGVKSGSDGSSINGQPTFSSTAQSCTSGDVGSIAAIAAGAAGGGSGTMPYGQTLFTVLSCNGSSWTFSVNATSTLSNLFWAMGKEAGAGLALAMASVNSSGKHLAIPCGSMMVATEPFPNQGAQNMAIQNQDITGCDAEAGATKLFVHPNITTTPDSQGSIIASANNTFAANTINYNGLSQVARVSNLTIIGMGGTMTRNSATNLFANYTSLDNIIVMGVCSNGTGLLYATISVGEARYRTLNFQAQCNSVSTTGNGGIFLNGQGTNTVADSVIAFAGSQPSGTPAITCNSNCTMTNDYITGNPQGLACGGGACKAMITGGAWNTLGSAGNNAVLQDNGNIGTFFVFGNTLFQQSGSNTPVISLTNASSVADVSGTVFNSTTSGCNVAGSGTFNDRGGNIFSSPLNGTGNCAFTGTYNPYAGGSMATLSTSSINVASRNTNFASTTLIPSVIATSHLDISIDMGDSAAGAACTTNTTVVWTVSYTDQTNTAQTATATQTITTNGGSTGGDALRASIPIIANVGTSVSISSVVTPGTNCAPTPSHSGRIQVRA